ncbi:MAG: hypothetical protein GDA56_13400 [Hormoscilla sp. GM7CHS1pb]|nr:hypothetical protein [Hormoscilla sp. GM7CHS1pb]
MLPYETAIRFNATFAKAHFNLGMTLPHSASRSHPTPAIAFGVPRER